MTPEIEKANKVIGQRIKKFREHAGLTQEELGKKTGYHGDSMRMAISKIETGSCGIPRKRLMLFADALNVDPMLLIRADFDPEETAQVEKRLLSDFLLLNEAGQQYFLDQLEFALLKFRKGDL